MSSTRRLVCTLGAALILCPACDLTDGPFHHGFGAVRGSLIYDGQPVAGAEVNWVGAEFDSAPEPSDEAGNFLLTGVPAGERELMIRAPEIRIGLREAVFIVGGHTMDAGVLELQKAQSPPVKVWDPDLGIGGVTLRLLEVPNLEERSNSNGAATLTCLPRSGCYNIEANAWPLSFAFEDYRVCPETDHDWENVPPLLPKYDENLTYAQVYNAYVTLQNILDPLTSCNSGCFVPEFWQDQKDPPCPWPLGDRHEFDMTYIGNLKTTVNERTGLDRFTQSNWSNITCPALGTWGSACIDNSCQPASLSSAGSARIENTGQGPKYCIPWVAGTVISVSVATQTVAKCLGTEPPVVEGTETYLFVTYGFPVRPTAAVVTVKTEGKGYDIFLRANLVLDPQSLDPGENDSNWALVRFDPPDGSPADPTFDAYLSWIDPVQ
jgi:hypothetical protein